jgi:hypothetical protein
MAGTKLTANRNLVRTYQSPRCEHMRLNGHRCAAPARSGSPWCIFHSGDYEGHFPITGVPEDAATIQVEIGRVIRLLHHQQIEPRAAALILYGLQIASQNVTRLGVEMPSLEEQAFPEKSQDLAWHIYFRLKPPKELDHQTFTRCVALAEFVRGESPEAKAALAEATADSSPAAPE